MNDDVTPRCQAPSAALRAQVKFVSEAEFDALLDVADNISDAAWKSLEGHDCFAAIVVIGTLIANVEDELGWSRERIFEKVSDIADSCDQPRGLSAAETPNSVEGVNND